MSERKRSDEEAIADLLAQSEPLQRDAADADAADADRHGHGRPSCSAPDPEQQAGVD
jgi:hypothetical protein